MEAIEFDLGRKFGLELFELIFGNPAEVKVLGLIVPKAVGFGDKKINQDNVAMSFGNLVNINKAGSVEKFCAAGSD